ncbi:hypothetical protein BJ944DRAFT_240833 [Cunninghamella echinulata]|nr:hypothetical protein BJ944DRAFT_240833 [Cunninghamella echinulata]
MENNIIKEQYFFFIGFIFPLVWLIGSTQWSCISTNGNNNNSNNKADINPKADKWKQRCRIASVIFLTTCIVIAALIMIFKPSAFGLLSSSNPTAQTSSSSDSANRPGVPIQGSNNIGDTIAGMGVYNTE